MEEQNFKNHTKLVPAFVFFVLPALGLNFVWSLLHWRKVDFSFGGLVAVLTAAALLVLATLARTFALRVQDRVIRLEERLRYERILPADLRARIGEFTVRQMIALRFASDAELPDLARKALDEKINNGKAIKQLVVNWRADHLRA
jgi:uncharacterized protein DUF6526